MLQRPGIVACRTSAGEVAGNGTGDVISDAALRRRLVLCCQFGHEKVTVRPCSFKRLEVEGTGTGLPIVEVKFASTLP